MRQQVRCFSTQYNYQVFTDGESYAAADFSLNFLIDYPGYRTATFATGGAFLYHSAERYMELDYNEASYRIDALDLPLTLFDASEGDPLVSITGKECAISTDGETWEIGYNVRNQPCAYHSFTDKNQPNIRRVDYYRFEEGSDDHYRIILAEHGFYFADSSSGYTFQTDYFYPGQYGDFIDEDSFRQYGPNTQSLGNLDAPLFADPYYVGESGSFFFSPLREAQDFIMEQFGLFLPKEQIYLAPPLDRNTRLRNIDFAPGEDIPFLASVHCGVDATGKALTYRDVAPWTYSPSDIRA